MRTVSDQVDEADTRPELNELDGFTDAGNLGTKRVLVRNTAMADKKLGPIGRERAGPMHGASPARPS